MEKVKGLSFGAAMSYHMQRRKIGRKGKGLIHRMLTRWAIALLGLEEDDWEVVNG